MLTAEQIKLVQRLVREVAAAPGGNGEVTIVIKRGIPRYIIPAPHIDVPYENEKPLALGQGQDD